MKRRKSNSISKGDQPKGATGDPTPLDAALAFRNEPKFNIWAKEAGLTRYKAMTLLKRAFENGTIHLPSFSNEQIERDLRDRFPHAEFCVIGARRRFAEASCYQLFAWVRSLVDNWCRQEPRHKICIAVGGGRGMELLCEEVSSIVKADGELRQWLNEKRSVLQFLNATAGGQPLAPQHDSSYLAVNFALHAGRQNVGVFSLSEDPVLEEKMLLDSVRRSPTIVITGIGAPNGAYCLEAMKSAGIFPADSMMQLLGEFLFHPILLNGKTLSDIGPKSEFQRARDSLLIKEPSADENSEPSQSRKRPIFASLFSIHSLRGWMQSKTEAPRRIIGIIHDTTENRSGKAKLLARMLRDNYFSHIILSSDLGNAIINESLKSGN